MNSSKKLSKNPSRHFIRCTFKTIALLLLLQFSLSVLPAQAETNQLIASLGGHSRHKLNADSFLDNTIASVEKLNDYQLKFSSRVYKGKSQIVEAGTMYFKNPGMLRVEEQGAYRKGSAAAVDRSGKIKGHLGGPLRFVVVELEADDEDLVSANGWPMLQSDLSSMLKAVRKMTKSGHQAFVSEHPVPMANSNRMVYVVELYAHDGKLLEKRFNIDAQTNLPVEWFDYKNGQLWSVSSWSDVKVNQNLPDALFKL